MEPIVEQAEQLTEVSMSIGGIAAFIASVLLIVLGVRWLLSMLK